MVDEESLEFDETAVPPELLAEFECLRQKSLALKQQNLALEQRIKVLNEGSKALEQQIKNLNKDFKDYGEFCDFCHYSILCRLKPQTDKSLVTTRELTSVHNKRHPPRMMFWQSFMDVQDEQHEALRRGLGDRKVFPTSQMLHYAADKVARTLVDCEDTLKILFSGLVTDRVIEVIEQSREIPAIADRYMLGHDREIRFTLNAKKKSSQHWDSDSLSYFKPDFSVVYMRNGDKTTRTTALVMEIKALHKVPTEVLKRGFRPMDIGTEVLGRSRSSVESDLSSQYDAEKLVAQLMTQMFYFMSQAGLKYGILTTGLAYVFAMIDYKDEQYSEEPSDEPITLYYFLSDPIRDVEEHGRDLKYSAVCQLAAFLIMVFDEVSREDPCVRARRKELAAPLNVWVSRGDGLDVSEPPQHQQRDEVGRLPKRPRPGYDGHDARQPNRRRSFSDDGYDPGAAAKLDRDIRARAQSDWKEDNNTRPASTSGTKKATESQYCTHKCLLGLITQDVLDENCPNIDLHRGAADVPDDRHPIDHATLLYGLREQLKKSLYQTLIPLGKEGAVGAIFRVTLHPYGYTFIGKGTVDEHVEEVVHEPDVYEHLEAIQGVHVPVFLGDIDLVEFNGRYLYDFDKTLTYFLFMSWGGRSLNSPTVTYTEDMFRAMVKALMAVYELGVIHRDMRKANVLWDDSKGQLMLIDFERSLLEDGPRPDLIPFVFAPHEAAENERAGDELAADRVKRYSDKFLDLQANAFDALELM